VDFLEVLYDLFQSFFRKSQGTLPFQKISDTAGHRIFGFTKIFKSPLRSNAQIPTTESGDKFGDHSELISLLFHDRKRSRTLGNSFDDLTP